MTETLEAYTFAQLSGTAKEKARDALRYTEHYLEHGRWDAVYEDAGRVATILGIDLMEWRKTSKGTSYQALAINFSGFSSQGDGACFRGTYTFNPEAVDEIKDYCKDEKLIEIASALFALQLARRMLGFEPFSATITTAGRYSRSGTMSIEVHFEEDDEHPVDAIEDVVVALMCSFADWIYAALEAEHDYQLSDEVVDRQLEDKIFDENGSGI